MFSEFLENYRNSENTDNKGFCDWKYENQQNYNLCFHLTFSEVLLEIVSEKHS